MTPGGDIPNILGGKENSREVLNSGNECNKKKSIIKKFIVNRVAQNQLTDLDKIDQLPRAQILAIREGFRVQ